ncbi:Glycosyl_transferase family 2 protein [Hexamita inflata]|uniref:Glycosyl transferase family 2 protein n=2 Tax=Hexamita inflata TaxID=28002 RepID=A0AA86TRY1_9EUKA|nr:Glycosyl transferase family 2 protein [Hexamita inflata]
MSQPLISLILPCYNQAANLRQSIPFLLNQSFKNFEIICVNDGSTDDTKAVIQYFQQLDSRVRLVEQKTNKGTLSTRLLGALNANGAYITQFDPDDRLSNTFVLQNLSEHLDFEPDILHFKMRLVFDPPNFKIEPYHWANPRKLQIEPENLMSSFITDDLSHTTTGKLVKRGVYLRAIVDLRELEEKRVIYIDDFSLMFALANNAQVYKVADVEGYDYYTNDESVMGMLSQPKKCLKFLLDTKNVYEACHKIAANNPQKYEAEFLDAFIRKVVGMYTERLYRFSKLNFTEEDKFNMCKIIDADYLNDLQYNRAIWNLCGYTPKWKTNRKCWTFNV